MNSGFTFNRFAVFTVERPSLDQFVLLSLMLHVLVIVLFGDTIGGGARRGEKLWGALTVTVQSLLPDRNVELKSGADKTDLQRPATGMRSTPATPKTNNLLTTIIENPKADLEVRRQATRALARNKQGAMTLVVLMRSFAMAWDRQRANGVSAAQIRRR